MKKMSTICAGVLMLLSLLFSHPVFGEDGVNVAHKNLVVVKVHGAPVGIGSERYRPGECSIFCGLLPIASSVIKKGETLRITVIGDKDVIVQCNGNKGITITRD